MTPPAPHRLSSYFEYCVVFPKLPWKMLWRINRKYFIRKWVEIFSFPFLVSRTCSWVLQIVVVELAALVKSVEIGLFNDNWRGFKCTYLKLLSTINFYSNEIGNLYVFMDQGKLIKLTRTICFGDISITGAIQNHW